MKSNVQLRIVCYLLTLYEDADTGVIARQIISDREKELSDLRKELAKGWLNRLIS